MLKKSKIEFQILHYSDSNDLHSFMVTCIHKSYKWPMKNSHRVGCNSFICQNIQELAY